VHQPRHVAAALRLHGHDEAARTHRDDRVLKKFLVSRGTDHAVELVARPRGGRADPAPDGRKLRGRPVRDLFLRNGDGGDAVFQVLIGRQDLEPRVERGLDPLSPFSPLDNAAQGVQHRADLQKLRKVQRAARLRPAQGVRYVFQAPERRGAEFRHHDERVVGFLQKPAHRVGG